MLVSFDLPEDLVTALENRAREAHSSLQDVAIEAICKEITNFEREKSLHHRARLPLVRSSDPGSLHSLTNADIDGILGH